MITAVLGACYGNAMWHACLSDFVVQVKGSAMAVSGPRVIELALGERVTEDELGGWKVHSEMTGMTDLVAENEEECFHLIRQFLGYMPSDRGQAPPDSAVPQGSGSDMSEILAHLPEQRNRVYDMNNILRCIVDTGSLFPIKPRFGRTVVTALGEG